MRVWECSFCLTVDSPTCMNTAREMMSMQDNEERESHWLGPTLQEGHSGQSCESSCIELGGIRYGPKLDFRPAIHGSCIPNLFCLKMLRLCGRTGALKEQRSIGASTPVRRLEDSTGVAGLRAMDPLVTQPSATVLFSVEKAMRRGW